MMEYYEENFSPFVFPYEKETLCIKEEKPEKEYSILTFENLMLYISLTIINVVIVIAYCMSVIK